MGENKASSNSFEFKTSGVLKKKTVEISEQSSLDALSQRGYGTVENEILRLAFYEALYLLDKGMLEVKGEKGENTSFQNLLQLYEKSNDNAWVNFLVYRDLRSRGYVVREGFGAGIDFRIYERGAYGKDIATYLILSTQEGKPVPIEDLTSALQRSKSQKKELILAVMNRRGEIVYYSVSQLTFK
jgi:tRNA-intron endonuclease, archaea type